MIKQIKDFLRQIASLQLGYVGYHRIDSTSGIVDDEEYYAILAMGADVTLGSNTEAINGTVEGGDTILQESVRFGRFKAIEVNSGTVYAYYR